MEDGINEYGLVYRSKIGEQKKDILFGKYGFMCQYDRKTNADTVWSVILGKRSKINP